MYNQGQDQPFQPDNKFYNFQCKNQLQSSSLQEQYIERTFQTVHLSTKKYKQWQFRQQYLNFFASTQISSIQSNKILTNENDFLLIKHSLQKILKEQNFVSMHNLKDLSSLTPNQIQIKIITSTKYVNVVEIMCQLGPFAKGYTVLNEKKQSSRHSNKLIQFGGFGKVYSCQEEKKTNQTVVKCLQFSQKTQINLKNFIKQFFICDLMSALEVGPQIIRAKGFDFIIFQNCLQFEMQKCLPYNQDTVQSNIKQSLLKMHILKITHCDIKPSNIMYSKSYGKNVFIDFGVSDILNHEWGLKSLVSFRGTYEYCGHEMKEIFMKNQAKLIDLYKNDVDQLNKTLKSIHFESKDSIFYEQPLISQLIPLQNSIFIVQDKQAIFLVKYHLYLNQYRSRPQKVAERFLDQIDRVDDEAILFEILTQSIKFSLHLQKLSLTQLRQYMIGKSPKMKRMNASLSEISLQDISKMETSQIETIFIDKAYCEKLKKLYHGLQRDQSFQNEKKLQQQFQWKFRDKQRVQSILQNDVKFNQLQNIQKYELFLKYCSFWRPSFKTTIQQKQYFAQNFVKLLELDPQKSVIKYYSEQYLPQLQFVKINCPCLVFLNAYLLTQLSQGDFNSFVEKFLTTILKDCIILGFQYYWFLTEVMNFYYTGLISQRNPSIIIFIVIQTSELYFLTNNHFLWTTSHGFYFQHKFKKYTLKQNLHEAIQHLKKTVSQSQDYYRKLKPLQVFWTTLMKTKKLMKDPHMYLNQYEQDLRLIISQICYEFSCVSILKSGNTLSLSIGYIYEILAGQKTEVSKLRAEGRLYDLEIISRNGFDLHVLLCFLRVYPANLVRENLLKLDQKINCKQLSDKFCIELRFRIAHIYPDRKQIMRILKMIVEFPGCPSYNYAHIMRVTPSFSFISQKFQKSQSESQFLYQYKLIMTKLHSIYRSLMCFFKEHSYFLNMCLIYWDNLNRNNLEKYLIQQEHHKRNVQFIQIVQKETFCEESQIYMLNFLLQTYEWYSLQYLTVCHKFFNLCKTVILSNQQFKSQNPKNSPHIQQNSEDYQKKQTVQFYFGSQLFMCYLFYDHFIKYWQNFLMKIVLGKAITVQHEFKKLSNAFIMKQKPNYIAQIIVVVCSQRDISKDGVAYFNGFFEHLDRIMAHSQLKTQIYTELIKYYKAFKQLLPQPSNILPLYCCILSFKTQLENNFLIWKTILIEACITFTKAFDIKILKKDAFYAYKMKIHQYVLDFMKFCGQKKKKELFLFRQIGKNLCEVNPYLFNGMRQYKLMQVELENFIKQLRQRRELKKQNKHKLNKLNQKVTKYLSNLSLKDLNLKQTDKQMQVMANDNKFLINLIKQHEIELRFMEEFKIKQLNLAIRYGITPKYIYLIKNKTLISIQQFDKGVEIIRTQVEKMKKSPQFHLSQNMYELVGKILQEERLLLTEQLITTYRITIEQLFQNADKYLFDGKITSRPKQVTFTLAVV